MAKEIKNIKFEDLPEVLSLDDIADFLHVTKPLVITIISENNIPTLQVGKKMVRVMKDDFKKAYIDRRQ